VNPGLESDQAAAVHPGGAPWWIAAGTHGTPALDEDDRTGAGRDPPQAAGRSIIAAVRQELAPRTLIASITPAAERRFQAIGTDRPAPVYPGTDRPAPLVCPETDPPASVYPGTDRPALVYLTPTDRGGSAWALEPHDEHLGPIG
jgi:hypothetical protein